MFALTFADTVIWGAQQQGVTWRTVKWAAMPNLCYLQLEACRLKCQDLQQALNSANTINDGHMQQADLVERLQEQVRVLYMSRQSMQSLSACYCEGKSLYLAHQHLKLPSADARWCHCVLVRLCIHLIWVYVVHPSFSLCFRLHYMNRCVFAQLA